MQFIGRKHNKMRQMIGAVLLLPFLLVAVLPNGVMPAASGDGWFTVTICTTDGLRTVVLDESGQEVPVDQNEDARHGSLCIFSLLSAELIGASALADLPTANDHTQLWSVQRDHISRRKVFNRLGARAPPILA